MGGRAFVVTQSIKKLLDTLKTAVFNNYGYKLLSSDGLVTVAHIDVFYVATTNLDNDTKTVFGISSNGYKIEDCFRITKTTLSSL